MLLSVCRRTLRRRLNPPKPRSISARQYLGDRDQDSPGKVDFQYSPEDIAQAAKDTGLVELPVSAAHAAKVAHLPLHHRDPFDRLLIAQILLLPAQLLTADSALVPYSELVRLV